MENIQKLKVFSGIQPSGNLHIGNYIGAISQWVKNQSKYENIFCIVDSHAITVPQDPKILKEKIIEVATWYLAAGIDPNLSTIFVQSQNRNHAHLAWILNCFTGLGQLNRMTQFKDKKEGKDFVSMGLYDYPVLMAADILLYNTDLVPVGEDQKQHVELTRDLADKFNAKFGKTFSIPKYMPPLVGERIMSLQHPDKKMSKSSIDDALGTIYLSDTPETMRNKIMKAVTDSGNEVVIESNKPAISNLVAIYQTFSEKSVTELSTQYSGKGYKIFKEDLADVVISHLNTIQQKYVQLIETKEIITILAKGLQHTILISDQKINEVELKVGLGL